MAATTMSASMATSVVAPSVLERSSFSGVAVQGLPVLRTTRGPSALRISANTVKKINVKEPLGDSQLRIPQNYLHTYAFLDDIGDE